MQRPKRITLQQYIECQNIKRELQARSRSKSRSKSKQKDNKDDTVLLNANQHSHSHNIDQTQIQKSISDQTTDKMAAAYVSIQEYITEVKFFARECIHSDKKFAQLSRMLNQLSKQFKLFMMKIHRQNLIMFQIKNQNMKIDLEKSILAKSFNAKWNQSKDQYERSVLPIGKTMRQKIAENKKTYNMIQELMLGKKTDSQILQESEEPPSSARSKNSKGGFIKFMLRQHTPDPSEKSHQENEQNNLKKQENKESDILIKSINQVNQIPRVNIKQIEKSAKSKQKIKRIEQKFDEQKTKQRNRQIIKEEKLNALAQIFKPKNEQRIDQQKIKQKNRQKIKQEKLNALAQVFKSKKNLNLVPSQEKNKNKNPKQQQTLQAKSPLPNLFSFMMPPPNQSPNKKNQLVNLNKKQSQLQKRRTLQKKQSLQKKNQKQKQSQIIKKTQPSQTRLTNTQKSKSKGKSPPSNQLKIK